MLSEQEFLKIVALNIKTQRLKKALSQKELARLVKINQSTLSKIETAKYSPNVLLVFDIANVLGVGIDGLLEGVE